MKDKLDEILLSVVNECEQCAMRGERIMCQQSPKEEMRLKCVNIAKAQILSLIRSWMPKKVDIDDLKPKPCPYRADIKCCTMQDFGFNSACDEMDKNIDDCVKGGVL